MGWSNRWIGTGSRVSGRGKPRHSKKIQIHVLEPVLQKGSKKQKQQKKNTGAVVGEESGII